ncbi:U6 snRNA-associated Sm-like protein LSm1 isoform X1 [Leptotrombidium deliense]|uniref:U6 snRNA-associated Sm-like protein LSm1 n=1 Tax=Leptotrombidium deliense TaxID=299467 RepID=A0A443S7V3_9ACAR|nr:U6 snRNA-associated Sm-like protein LSm1 isoform X1 [Leptotrombidium deliense]
MTNYLPGTASLLEDLDKKLMVLLRDGRTLIGYLRSIDQFANLVLHQAIERIHVGNKYGDIPIGIFVIRGENVVLCGEIDTEKDEKLDLIRVPVDEILAAQKVELEAKREKDKLKFKAMQNYGVFFNADAIHEDF